MKLGFEEAQTSYTSGSQSARAWTEAWVNLAAELAVLSRFSEARGAVEKALALDPENAEARALNDQLARDPAARQ